MASFNHQRFQCCFQNWIAQQHQDLEELLHALTSDPPDDKKLHLLTQKSIKHLEEHHDNRALLYQHGAPSFFSPSWCSTLENSFLWIGGCRPTLFIQLFYSLCGSKLEAQLTEFLQGERKGNLAGISAHQLNLIDSLHRKTVREEEKFSTRMASLQEDMADEPIVMIAKNCSRVGESSEAVDQALDAHALALAHTLVEADKLRLSTLKELMDILTPFQAVDLLVASMKLHLSIHEWGKTRDHHMGQI